MPKMSFLTNMVNLIIETLCIQGEETEPRVSHLKLPVRVKIIPTPPRR